MNGVEIPLEAQRAFGYAGIGALTLKALDVLVKWRSGQRNDALTELSEARQLSRDIREELRRDLAARDIQLATAESQLEESEMERLKLRRQLVTTDEALKNATAELRSLRAVHSQCDRMMP